MGFNQESIHNVDSWLCYRGQQQTIQFNKLASIRASPRVAAQSIIRPYEASLDNESADALCSPAPWPTLRFVLYDLKIDLCLKATARYFSCDSSNLILNVTRIAM